MLENAPRSKSESGNESIQLDDYSYTERKPFWKILLISALVTGLVAAVVYFGFINRPDFFSNHNSVVSSDSSMVITPKAELPGETSVAPPVVASESTVVTSQNKYHIIAGAFVIEKNAATFMEQLQKNGYDPKIVLKRNEYSFVSIFSFPTFREANEKYHTFDGSGMPVWIMKY